MPLPTTADEVWPHIEKWPFGVLSFVTPKGESRSAGIMYQVKDRVLYVLTGEDTWKVRHIRSNPNVSMTVPIQRLPIRIRQMQERIEKIEARIHLHETRIEVLNRMLATEDLYRDQQLFRSTMQELDDLQAELDRLMDQWENQQHELDSV